MHSERLAYIEKLNNEEELSVSDIAALIAEVRRYEMAMYRIIELEFSEGDDPLDDAICIAKKALAVGCETVPVQQSGQATAEHGGDGADPILREAVTPTLGIEAELRRRWKQYRDNAVSNEFCNTEQIAFGGRAGGLLEAINLIEAIPLSDAKLSTTQTL